MKKRIRGGLGIACLCGLFLLMGCAGAAQNSGGICGAVPAGQTSVICELSSQFGTTPETVAGILKIGNAAALAGNLYAAREANAFIEETKGYLEQAKTAGNGILYAVAVAYVSKKYLSLSAAAQAAFVVIHDYIDDDANSLRVLSDFDIDMLIAHLDEQAAIIAPFMAIDG